MTTSTAAIAYPAQGHPCRPIAAGARALYRRDMLRFARDRGRWVGVAAQPLLFWLLIGGGLDSTFTLPNAPDVGYLAYFFPGIVVLAALFAAMFATMSLIEDRQEGLIRLALASPLPSSAVIAAKVASATTLGVLQATALLLLAPVAGYPYSAIHWPAVIALLTLGAASLSSLGVALAWRLGSVHAYHAIMSVVLIPLWILSGAMFPAADGAAGWLVRLNPLAYVVEGIAAALSGHAGYALGLTWQLAVAVVASTFAVLFTATMAVAHHRGTQR